MFLGTFPIKANGKWQIALPAKIRSALGGDRAVITTGFDKCVYGFALTDWEKTAWQELQKPISTQEGRKVRQQMFAGALEVDLDGQGRFVVLEYLRKYGGLAENLVVIGAGDHFEIWNESEYQKMMTA